MLPLPGPARGDHPATLTAFWCWQYAAILHEKAGELAQAASDLDRQVLVAQAIGDSRMVQAAQGAARAARERAAAAAAKSKQP